MATITLDLPPDLFASRRLSPDEFAAELRLAAAIHWYSRGEVSQEKGAQIAGVSRTDFILALAREKVEVVQVNLEELKREIKRA